MIVFPLVSRFFRAVLGEPRAQNVMNKWLMYFWVANLVGVHLVFFFANSFWQKASILYLADISVYACIGQHYTGMTASLTGLKADDRAEALEASGGDDSDQTRTGT
jgi:hypothetical protein